MRWAEISHAWNVQIGSSSMIIWGVYVAHGPGPAETLSAGIEQMPTCWHTQVGPLGTIACAKETGNRHIGGEKHMREMHLLTV